MRRNSYAVLGFAAVLAVTAAACGGSGGGTSASGGNSGGNAGSKSSTGGSGGIGGSGNNSGGSGGGSGGAAGGKSGTGGSGGVGNSGGSGGSNGGTAGGKSGTGGSAGIGGGGGPTDAAVPTTFPFPAVTDQGGPLITAPKVVTITFPGDTMAAQLDSYGSTAASTAYWDTVRAGYCSGGSCVGDGPAGVSVALATAPATMYTDSAMGGPATLQTFLAGLITAGTVPAPDANTIYALYFPSTTTINEDGGLSCRDFLGYHNAFTMGAQTVYFAVIPECPSMGMTPPITLLQNTTLTASHEIIETATDGSTQAVSFYLNLNDPATWGWNDAAFGGEVADLCVDQFGLDNDETTENGFTVQRVWSVANAAAGKNPCVPIPAGEVYFNAFTQYSVVVMNVGASKTFDVHALADGPMPAWNVMPQDWSGGATPYLKFSIAGGTNVDGGSQIQVQSGDTFQLTVTLLADPTNSPNGEADGVIVSANGSSTTTTAAHFWPFIVLSTHEAQTEGVMMELQRRHAQAKGPGRRALHRALP